MPADASRCSSSTSSSSSCPNSPTWRTGATMKCTEASGNLFSRTMARVPRRTTSLSWSCPSTAAQKTQLVSSSADLMYSRRQGAHNCFTQPLVSDRLARLDPHARALGASPHRREPGQRRDHAQDQEEGGGEQDRAEHGLGQIG